MGKRPKLDYEIRTKDVIPEYGIINYVKRNIEDLGSMEISLRNATLVLYNLYLVAGLTLASIEGLERLVH